MRFSETQVARQAKKEFPHYSRYVADGVLIDLLFVLDPADKERALCLFILVV